jgi:hypothetical protein
MLEPKEETMWRNYEHSLASRIRMHSGYGMNLEEPFAWDDQEASDTDPEIEAQPTTQNPWSGIIWEFVVLVVCVIVMILTLNATAHAMSAPSTVQSPTWSITKQGFESRMRLAIVLPSNPLETLAKPSAA